MLRGNQTHDLPDEIATCLAIELGGHPTDYEVSAIDEAPYFMTCANHHLRDMVIYNSPYAIPRLGVEFEVEEWQPNWGLTFEPLEHEAWISLIGLPFQVWNGEDIRRVTARLGYQIEMLPFGLHARQFRHITIRLACHHPANLPKFLKYREGDMARMVELRLIVWRPRQRGHFPLNYEGDPWNIIHNEQQEQEQQQPPMPSSSSEEGYVYEGSYGSNSTQPSDAVQMNGARKAPASGLTRRVWIPKEKKGNMGAKK